MLPPLHTLSLRCCAPVPTGVNLQESANGMCPLCSGPMQLTLDNDDGGILSELMDPRLPALVEETRNPSLGDEGLRQWASPTAVVGDRRYHRRCLVTYYAHERDLIAADARTGKPATIPNNPYVRFPEAADERTQQQMDNKELPHYKGHPTQADTDDIDDDTRSIIMGTGSAAFRRPYTLEQLTDQEQEKYRKALDDVDAMEMGERNLLSAQGAADRAQLRANRSSFWEKQAMERARDAVRGTPESVVQTLIDERLAVVRKQVEAEHALNQSAVRRATDYAEAEVKVAQSEAAWAQEAVRVAQREAAAAKEAEKKAVEAVRAAVASAAAKEVAKEAVEVAQSEAAAAAAGDAAIKVRNAQTERTQAVRALAAATKSLEKAEKAEKAAKNASTASAEIKSKLEAKLLKVRQDLTKANEEVEKVKRAASLSAKETIESHEAIWLATILEFEEKLEAKTAELEDLKKKPNPDPDPDPDIDTDGHDDAWAKQLDVINADSKGPTREEKQEEEEDAARLAAALELEMQSSDDEDLSQRPENLGGFREGNRNALKDGAPVQKYWFNDLVAMVLYDREKLSREMENKIAGILNARDHGTVTWDESMSEVKEIMEPARFAQLLDFVSKDRAIQDATHVQSFVTVKNSQDIKDNRVFVLEHGVTMYAIVARVYMPFLLSYYYEHRDMLKEGEPDDTALSRWVEKGLHLETSSLMSLVGTLKKALNTIFIAESSKLAASALSAEKAEEMHATQASLVSTINRKNPLPIVASSFLSSTMSDIFLADQMSFMHLTDTQVVHRLARDMDQAMGFPPGHISKNVDMDMLREMYHKLNPRHQVIWRRLGLPKDQELRVRVKQNIPSPDPPAPKKSDEQIYEAFTTAWRRHFNNAISLGSFRCGKDTPLTILNEFLISIKTNQLIKQARKGEDLRPLVTKYYESRRRYQRDVNVESLVAEAFKYGIGDYVRTMQRIGEKLKLERRASVFYENAEFILLSLSQGEIRAQGIYPMEKRSNPYLWPNALLARNALVYYYYQPLEQEEVTNFNALIEPMRALFKKVVDLRDNFEKMANSMKNPGQTIHAISNKLIHVVLYLRMFWRSFELKDDDGGFTVDAKADFLILLRELRMNLDAMKFLKDELRVWGSSAIQPAQLDVLQNKLKKKSGEDGPAVLDRVLDLLDEEDLEGHHQQNTPSTWDTFDQVVSNFFNLRLYDQRVVKLFNDDEDTTKIGTKNVRKWVLETWLFLVGGGWERVVDLDSPPNSFGTISQLDERLWAGENR